MLRGLVVALGFVVLLLAVYLWPLMREEDRQRKRWDKRSARKR